MRIVWEGGWLDEFGFSQKFLLDFGVWMRYSSNRELKFFEQDSKVLGFVFQKNIYGSNLLTGGREIEDKDAKLRDSFNGFYEIIVFKQEKESINGMERSERGRKEIQSILNVGFVLGIVF